MQLDTSLLLQCESVMGAGFKREYEWIKIIQVPQHTFRSPRQPEMYGSEEKVSVTGKALPNEGYTSKKAREGEKEGAGKSYPSSQAEFESSPFQGRRKTAPMQRGRILVASERNVSAIFIVPIPCSFLHAVGEDAKRDLLILAATDEGGTMGLT